jgi:hypothetical protein
VPRDRAGGLDPAIARRWQRRSGDVDIIELSLYAKGPTTGEISAHFAEIYGASVSEDTVSGGSGSPFCVPRATSVSTCPTASSSRTTRPPTSR